MKKLFLVMLVVLSSTMMFAETIKVLTWDDAHSQSWKTLTSEFEKATGIKVSLELIPSGSMLQKTSLNVTENKANYDLVAIDEGNVAKFGDLLIPYSQWPEGKIFPKVGTDDIPAAIFAAAEWDGELVGIPNNGNMYIWMTRKDLVEDESNQKAFQAEYGYDLQVPETFDQLLDMSIFFSEQGIFGFAPFTANSEGATCEAILFYESFGTSPLTMVDGKYEVTLDRTKAAEAINYYKELIKYSPEGSLSMGHAERIGAFSDGLVFSMFQWPGIVPSHENEDESMVAGQILYTAPPSGPEKRAAVRGCWIFGIPKASEHQSAAAEFAYWVNNYTVGLKLAELGMTPVRTDLLQELSSEKPWYAGMAEAGVYAVSRPNRSTHYPEYSDVIKTYWLAAVTEKMTPEEAVESTINGLDELLEKYE
ncbi:MAG TPA: extracellular solute-binding protein [Thermotogota bacterium]|nr:extracellular solute-binding protein [Thermotogota bacterium]HPR94767.1 extracellular solute-binding protein [Thermotogota bacterium]